MISSPNNDSWIYLLLSLFEWHPVLRIFIFAVFSPLFAKQCYMVQDVACYAFFYFIKKMFICLQMLSQSAQNQEQMLHKFLGNTAIYNHKTSHFLILYTISTVHTQIT